MGGQDNPKQESGAKPPSAVLVPLGLTGFCAAAFWLTTQFDRVPPILKRGIQPSDFPQLVIVLIVFLSVILMIRDRARPEGRIGPAAWGSLGCIAGFAAVAQTDLFLGLGLFAAALAALWGERRILVIGMLGAAAPALVFLLFDMVFEVRFPRGLLTSLWYG